jgi:isopenicillin-N N-acyltransferase like protein
VKKWRNMKEFAQSDILTLFGAPRKRGRIHGETFRTKIQELMDRWKAWLALTTGNFPGQYIQDLVSETKFINAVERWTPGLLEEVKGIAEGAGVDFNDIFAFQLLDEEWWFDQEKKQAQQSPARNCSSIGWQGTATLVAQNMDLPDYLDGYQVVLRIIDPQSDIESLIFSTVGLLALNGINNHSIGIVCNNLGQLNHSREGLPVAYVHRGVLEKRSFSEAKSFLEKIQHASGQNYLLGSAGKIVDLECSANQVAAYTQPERSGRICHTNHPFVNTDFRGITPGTKPTREDLVAFFDTKDVNSRTRFEVIFQQFGEIDNEKASPEAAKRLLQSHDSSTHPVCRHSKPGLPWMTLGTSIMELGSNPQLHVCPGPPCSSIFSLFGF